MCLSAPLAAGDPGVGSALPPLLPAPPPPGAQGHEEGAEVMQRSKINCTGINSRIPRMVYRITKRNGGKEEGTSPDDIKISDWNFERENDVTRSKPGIDNRMIPTRLLRATDGRL